MTANIYIVTERKHGEMLFKGVFGSKIKASNFVTGLVAYYEACNLNIRDKNFQIARFDVKVGRLKK